MKKLFTTIALVMSIVALTFSQDVIVKPKKVISINKTSEKITLDGLAKETSWANAATVQIDSGDVNNTEGFSASFKAIWDADYIYLLITAVDQNPYLYDGSNSWEKDGVQSYFDVRDSLVVGKKMAWQHTLPFCYGMTHATMDALSDFPIWNDSTLATYANLGTTLTDNGWMIEARIPIVSLYYNGDDITDYESCQAVDIIKANDTIGFAIQANNYNATIATPARTAVVTYPGGGDTWENSSLWGGLKLVDAGSLISNASASSFKIYPNPVVDKLKVELNGLKSIEVINIAGQVLLKQVSSANSITVNLSGLDAGMYFVRANGNANTIQKFIKR
jgi:Carbohydrate family 9 binding domain-like/Secretion system C-terminal sorting domain